jgi:hypothetical protein
MAIVEAREAQQLTKLTGGLDLLQLNPKDSNGKNKLSGMDLFNHMCYFRNVNATTTTSANGDGGNFCQEPSSGLNLELSHDNLECIQPTESEVRRGAIMRDAFGERAARKCLQRKLNNLAIIVGRSTAINNDANMLRAREQLEFANSMAEIERRELALKKLKEKECLKLHFEKAPSAVAKLEANGSIVASLTKGEVESLLYAVYDINLGNCKGSSKLKKGDYVKALEKEFERDIKKYEVFVVSLH